jgi:uncharacterized protein
MRILVTGGTGLVGRRLLARLAERGEEALVLSRQANPLLPAGCIPVLGDAAAPGPWLDQLDGCQAVIHLAGENVFAHRWTRRFKQRLHDSRALSTRLIAERLARRPGPAVLVTASAIGYYGPHRDEELDESSPPGDDFLALLCRDWEKAAEPAASAGVRVARLRIGMVLDNQGGALTKMLPPFRFFLGGPIGNGKQWVSWIHIADLVGLSLFALDHAEVIGPINATAPEPLTNWGFGKVLGKVLHRPSWLPTPAWALRLVLGQVASVATTGQRVLPQRAVKFGYAFQFPDLELALRDLLESR